MTDITRTLNNLCFILYIAVSAVLALILMFTATEAATGLMVNDSPMHIVFPVFLVVGAVTLFFVRREKTDTMTIRNITKPFCAVSLLLGAVMVVSSVMDIGSMTNERISTAMVVISMAAVVFGVLSGGFFIWQGVKLLRQKDGDGPFGLSTVLPIIFFTLKAFLEFRVAVVAITKPVFLYYLLYLISSVLFYYASGRLLSDTVPQKGYKIIRFLGDITAAIAVSSSLCLAVSPFASIMTEPVISYVTMAMHILAALYIVTFRLLISD